MHERQDPSYFLAALQILTSFQEESNLWKHQLLSAIATQREQHMLHMLEELWKSIEHHVLLLKKQLSLHLHSDSNVTIYLIFSSSLMRALWMPQVKAGCKLWSVVTSSLQIFSRSTYHQRPSRSRLMFKWSIPSFILHLKVTDTEGQKREMSWQGGATSQRCEQRTWDCLSSPLISVWNWEYLLLQTSAACHIRLYYVKLCDSGTLSDALYIFALPDLKGVNQWNQWQWIWGRKKEMLSHAAQELAVIGGYRSKSCGWISRPEPFNEFADLWKKLCIQEYLYLFCSAVASWSCLLS